ncbi:MAG: SDR family oxidoreductase [Anaerolineae bacterium]|nr:SDR family oxidoreductase [Anaerolineae bacterium]
MGNEAVIEQLDGSEIAIIGLACRFPGANDLEKFWQNLVNGVESITDLPDEEIDLQGWDAALLENPSYVKRAPLLENVDKFDAGFFGLTPKEAEVMDPQQRFFLECAWEALERAGYNPETYEENIGVFAGARTNTYLYNLVTNPEVMRSLGAFEIGLGNDLAFMTSRVSFKLNLRGPSYSIHTACSTALAAVHLACQSLLIHECHMALAGGVAINVPQKTGYLYQPGGIVSPDGHCRAFDVESQGTLFGSGVGIVVLKRLEEAILEGDQIYAVIRGTATNNDGARKASFTAPGVQGQEDVILEALAAAGVEPDEISYIETHGTGTALGDTIEIRALARAFGTATDETGFCALGSVKTNFGHLDAAAGIASLIKTVLALQHKTLPPTLYFNEPNPNIDFANTPFYVNARQAPWQTKRLPRRAGVSSFGIGGTNAHIVLEEAPHLAPSGETRSSQLLLLSARSEAALAQATHNLASHLQTRAAELPDSEMAFRYLADAAYTLQVGRKAFKHRLIAVCQTLTQGAKDLEALTPGAVFSDQSEVEDRNVAFLFPGQGAQYVQMSADLYQAEPVFREQVDHCAELLEPHLGLDLRTILFPEATQTEVATAQLQQTAFTQPALFVIEYALAQLWQSWGIRPQAMLGHSIGEYVAACLAGVFSLETALALVAARGRFMQSLPEGGMLAVFAGEDVVQASLSADLSLAAVNLPEQCVVSGTMQAIEQLSKKFEAEGIEVRHLRTSHAFHSSMMEPILDKFAALVGQATLQSPQLPFLSNVSGTWITDDEATNPEYWGHHLRQTVRFSDNLSELLKNKDWVLLEVGPGKTLTRMVRQHDDYDQTQVLLASSRHPDQKQPDDAFILKTLGRLWLAGVQVDWAGFYAQEKRHRAPLPTYPFERQRYWIEARPVNDTTAVSPRITRKIDDVDAWLNVPSWKRVPLPSHLVAQELEDKKTWLLFMDEMGIAKAIADRLQQAKQTVICVFAGDSFSADGAETFVINPQEAIDYLTLLQELQQQKKLPDSVLHLWNVTARLPTAANGETFKQAQWLGYYSLLFLAQALAQANVLTPLHIWAVSNHLQEVESHDTVQPEKATLLGPCRVIPQEYAHITCHSLDLDENHPELIRQILAEVTAVPSDFAVAYRGRRRWVQTFECVTPFDNAPVPLKEQGVYLITGGLGGVGQILARTLAESYRARLVITSRSPFPPPEDWEVWLKTHDDNDRVSRNIHNIRELESLGAAVLILQADVVDEAQMKAAIEQIKVRFGQLNGVLHAAGVTSGSSVFTPLADIGINESETQFGPKAYGLYILESVLQLEPLDFCLLFSSNAAILGGLGFVAYSASNGFMDAFALSRSGRTNWPWISANWDHWPEETKQYAGFQTSMEQFTMTVAESEAAFKKVLTLAKEGHVVVSTGDLTERMKVWISRESTEVDLIIHNGRAAHPRPAIQSIYVAPETDTEKLVASIWQEVLGIELVGIHDSFFDLGGHSLLATRLIARLRDAFQVDLPLSHFFESPTVAELARRIDDAQGQTADEETMAILEMLAEMSDDEAATALKNREELAD